MAKMANKRQRQPPKEAKIPEKTPKKAAASSSFKKSAKKAAKIEQDSMVDWISSLAKSSASDAVVPTKQERQQKRADKKARRDAKRPEPEEKDEEDIRVPKRESKPPKKSQLEISKKRLEFLTATLRSISRAIAVHKQRPVPFSGKNQPLKRKKGNWDENSIQPGRSDYCGMGLARDSLYVSFDDPSFFPKLEEEFVEHIPGFFGKQRTKAMKKQLDGNMLWRQMAQKDKMETTKVHGKKLSDMTPDDRVQAMIDAGMVWTTRMWSTLTVFDELYNDWFLSWKSGT